MKKTLKDGITPINFVPKFKVGDVIHQTLFEKEAKYVKILSVGPHEDEDWKASIAYEYVVCRKNGAPFKKIGWMRACQIEGVYSLHLSS